MSAFGNIAILDGQATPVAHTFTPLTLFNNASGSIATYVNRASALVDIGFEEIKLSFRTPSGERVAGAKASSERIYKVAMTLKVPVLESTSAATGTGIAPAPTVAYVLTSKVEFLLPARSTTQQRKDLRTLTQALLWRPEAVSLVENMEGIF